MSTTLTSQQKQNIFEPMFKHFETEEILEYFKEVVTKIPNGIFYKPASSSGKYHNSQQIGDYGQLIHIYMFSDILNMLLDLEYNKNKFPNPILDLENDLCRTYKDEEDGLMHFDVERLPNGNLLEQMKFGIIGLLQPERVLDILQHFIVFERDNGKIIKKVARYQQLRAANKIVERVTHTDKNRGSSGIRRAQESRSPCSIRLTNCARQKNWMILLSSLWLTART